MKIFVYSGTHWDREWYESFQGFRHRLVHMTDDLIEGLESQGDYHVFHFDGQTVVLGDYLEIRPEMRARLTELIRKGKIRIGPWYDMPDEFLISGESMIRNLQLGFATARGFGVEPAKCAYICDIFGHTAQAPQIFAGMDLHHTVLGRGTNEHNTPMFFRWAAPDGTEVLAVKLDDAKGYGDFSAFAHFNPLDGDPAAFEKNARAYIDHQIGRTPIPMAVLFDAQDHQFMRRDTALYLKKLSELYPDVEFVHGDIDGIDAEIDAYAAELPVRGGEINEAAKRTNCGYLHLITNTLSSRYPLKQYNDRMQTRLEKWVSPAYAFGLTDDSEGFLRLAYRFLLQNHPHDSICGCSIDQVHRDMMYRFDQVNGIASEVLKPCVRRLSGGEGPEKILNVFNPLPYAVCRTVEAELRLEKSFPSYAEPFEYEYIHAFRLYDESGAEVPYGITDIRVGRGDKDDLYRIVFDAKLTAAGVTQYRVAPETVPTRYPQRIPGGVDAAEGDKVWVEVCSDGTICLTDAETGEVYPNLLQLVDDGEIGDGWFHVNPAIDRTVTCNTAFIEKVEDNAVRTTFHITQQMRLPRKMTIDHGYRRDARETVCFEVEHFVSVARSSKAVRVRTLVHNNAMDHRLRLRLQTAVGGPEYWANEAFCFVRRACGDRPETANWKEYGLAEKAMSGIVFKQDPENPKRGLAFVSAFGLHECAAWENGDIDVTLLRAFDRTVQTEGEPDGELQQTLDYEYELIPLSGSEEPFAMLQREQDLLAAGLVFGTGRGEYAKAGDPVFAVDGDSFVYSTASRLDGHASELRLTNYSASAQSGTLTLPRGTVSARLTEIDGRPIRDLPVENGKVRLTLGPWKIATVRFEK